ncbi:MAG: TRAP transporter small permease [Pseudomonadota bacterium]
MIATLKRLVHWLHRLEDMLLIALLVMMMSAAVLQILVRNVSDSGIAWADPLIRILVLWAGLLGAMAATRQEKHITIDVLTRYLSPRARSVAGFLTMTATGILCAITAWFSLDLVRMEFGYHTPAFAGVPTWVCQSIIPAAFFIIAIRCLLTGMTHIHRVVVPKP